MDVSVFTLKGLRYFDPNIKYYWHCAIAGLLQFKTSHMDSCVLEGCVSTLYQGSLISQWR